jgi:pyridoxal/pyridoxine/pyridoxamine kinase
LKPLFTLAIGSFAVHGTASLKTFTHTLGEHILPVPSVLLNGLTNMQLVKRFDTPFQELLEGSFELAVHREVDLILYIGYLGNAQQAVIIKQAIQKYRPIIKTIITDPVCGDHGRAYVSKEVIEQWPSLIEESDCTFPNLTELKILTNQLPEKEGEPDVFIQDFITRFPQTNLIATSIPFENNSIGIKVFGKEVFTYAQKQQLKHFGGTGDALVAHFILYHYYKQLSFEKALKKAVDRVALLMQHSIAAGTSDLLLNFPQEY